MYPKGYTEVLERQTVHLVTAIREMYKREKAGRSCFGDLQEVNGAPLTHDVLVELGILVSKPDGSSDDFEEDTQKLQQRLIDRGAEMTARRASVSSGSEHSGPNELVQTPSDSQSTPFEAKPNLNDYSFSAPPSPPNSQSPALHDRQLFPNSQPAGLYRHDPQLYQAPWALQAQNPNPMLRSNSFALESPMGNTFYNPMGGMDTFGQWSPPQPNQFDAGVDAEMDTYQTYPQQPSAHFSGPLLHMSPNAPFETPDVDYTQFLRNGYEPGR